MSERLLYHVELANQHRREGDDEIRGLLDGLNERLTGTDKEAIQKMIEDRLEEFWTSVCERIDDRVLTLKLKQDERFDKLEEGLRDFHQDLLNLDRRMQRDDGWLEDRVRTFDTCAPHC